MIKSSSITWLCAAACLFVGGVVWTGPSQAQVGQELSEAALREPWNRQLAVLESLAEKIIRRGARVGDDLARLEVALGEYESQCDQVIDRIIADSQFAYVATETSQALALQLAEVHARFAAFYATLDVHQRADVAAAQAALDDLRKVLAARQPFERDVIGASVSGTRQPRVELATRWWKGEEQAIAVKKLVGSLRQQVEGIAPGAEES